MHWKLRCTACQNLSSKKTAFSAGPILNTLLVGWLLFWALPVMQLALTHSPLFSEAIKNVTAARDIVNMFIAISTMPISVAGLVLAFSSRNRLFMLFRAGGIALGAMCLMTLWFLLWQPSYGYLYRAYWHAMMGQDNDAIADCTTAARIDPKLAGARLIRGWTYSLLGGYQRAITDYTAAIRLDPEYICLFCSCLCAQ